MAEKFKQYRFLVIGAVVSLLVYSCASMGSPSGGDYDLDPPVVVRTMPAMNATNANRYKG